MAGQVMRRLAVLGLAGLSLTTAAFAAGVAVGAGRAAHSASLLDAAAGGIARSADVPVSTGRLDAAAVRAMLSTLDDRWASYYGAGESAGGYSQLHDLLDGHYSGLGVWLRRCGGPGSCAGGAREMLLASVLAGSPAAAAGLRVGDELVAVDGVPVAGLDVDSVVSRLRGPAGSAVTLTVARGGVTRLVVLRRTEVLAGDVTTDWPARGILRIRVADFSAGVGSAVRQAVAAGRAHGLTGIVLDLRGDPGGLLAQGVAVASVFLDGGPVVSVSGRSVPAETLMAAPGGDVSTPLAVLVDGGTASAAEVVTGALQDRGRAVVVGSRTFGKGSVQAPIPLPGGSAIELTVAHYRTPSGRSLDAVGLQPDVVVAPQAPTTLALQRAVQLLQGLADSTLHATAAGL